MPRRNVLSAGARRAETLPVRFADDEATQLQIVPATEQTPSSRFFPHYMPRRPTNGILHGSSVNGQDPSIDDPCTSPVEWQEPYVVTNNDNVPRDRPGQQPFYILNSRGRLVPIDGPDQTTRGRSSHNLGRTRRYERSQRHSIDSESESDNEIRRNSSPPSQTHHYRPSHSPDHDSWDKRSNSDVSSDADVPHAYSFGLSRHDKSSASQESTLWSLPEHSEEDVVLPRPKESIGSSILSKVHQVFRSEYIGEGSLGGLQAARLTIMGDGISGPYKPLPLFRWM